MVQMVKNLPAMQQIQVQPLDWKDSLKKGMATHSNILAWRVPRTEKPVGYSLWAQKEANMTEKLAFSLQIGTYVVFSARPLIF